ncbi:hypothetical protein Q6A89_07860 [Aliarcobacter skirrowii]|uniref:hypothetical protein n=1 Tax=Aliarcobacter skirrowii TaxID=28200 RepID=UPI0029A48A4C|nr:hypothetical protein [Aliarcobacter skirrowii]MDX4049122.1 hypothetical protein [Aliarcobacter skirrowii]MDX4060425.1 hypothetical protein [Aliarcobacter skirrowii]
MKEYNKIIIPSLAKCINRNEAPKKNEKTGHPEDWFSDELLLKYGLKGYNVDFFINWNNYNISNEIWIKGILVKDKSLSNSIENINDLKSEIDRLWGLDFIKSLSNFFLSLGYVYLILFDDNSDWKNSENILYKVKIKNDGHGNFSLKKTSITLDCLKNDIRNLSGGVIEIGSKGLFYGTSSLECTLSTTDALYPGDADMILVDDNNTPVAILEFKKHTKDSPIRNQKLSNYYPRPDKRKYDRLFLLQNELSAIKNKRIPLLVIYYPTKNTHKTWKIEQIEGSMNNGNIHVISTGKDQEYNLPDSNNLSTYEDALKNLLDFIKTL